MQARFSATAGATTQWQYICTTPLTRHYTFSESRPSGRYNRITPISMDQGHEISIYGICSSRNIKLPPYNTSLLNRVKEVKFPMSIEHDRFNSRIWGHDRFLSSLQCWPRVHRISVENQYSRLYSAPSFLILQAVTISDLFFTR